MTEIEDSGEIEKLLNSQEPVAIFFYMNGCPHCENMQGPWKNLAKKHSGIKFVKIEQTNTPDHLGITGFPQFITVEKGKQKKSVGGEMLEKDLEKKLFGSNGLLGGKRTRRLRARRLRRRTGKKH